LPRLTFPRLAFVTLAAVLALAGCGKPAPKGPEAKYAGLDAAILAWHGDLEKTDPRCLSKPATGEACQTFEIACKGEQAVTPADEARGVTAKIGAAITWEGWNAERNEYQPAADFAVFSKTGDAWARAKSPPLNLATCGAG
jgi:hypothetical protein